MERLAQYWDDLDDLFWSFAASGERVRVLLYLVASISIVIAAAAVGVLLGLSQPALAFGAASLMTVFVVSRAFAMTATGASC